MSDNAHAKGALRAHQNRVESRGRLAKTLNSLGIFCFTHKNGAVAATVQVRKITSTRLMRIAGIDGCSDVSGLLPDGRRLDIAFLRAAQPHPAPAQVRFLNKINENGGVGIYCNSTRHAIELLQELGYLKGVDSEQF